MDAWSATLRGDEARLRELLRLDLHHVDDVHPVSGQSILHLACAQRKESIVGFILRKGADPDLKDGLLGETALHKAAARGLARAVQMLVAVGADRDALNRRGQRPIDLARKTGDTLSIRVLGDSEARRARMRGKFHVADLLETDQDAPELDEDLEKLRELEKRYFLARRSGDEYRAALESVEDDLRERDDIILNLQNEIRELRGVVTRETKRADDAVATAQRLRAASDGASKLQSESKRLQRAIESERKRREEDKRLWARERERLETKFRDQYNLNFDLQREVIETSRSRQQTYRERS